MEIQKTVQDTEIRAGLESRLPQSHLLHRLLSRPAQEKLRAVSEYLQYREIPPAEKLQVTVNHSMIQPLNDFKVCSAPETPIRAPAAPRPRPLRPPAPRSRAGAGSKVCMARTTPP